MTNLTVTCLETMKEFNFRGNEFDNSEVLVEIRGETWAVGKQDIKYAAQAIQGKVEADEIGGEGEKLFYTPTGSLDVFIDSDGYGMGFNIDGTEIVIVDDGDICHAMYIIDELLSLK